MNGLVGRRRSMTTCQHLISMSVSGLGHASTRQVFRGAVCSSIPFLHTVSRHRHFSGTPTDPSSPPSDASGLPKRGDEVERKRKSRDEAKGQALANVVVETFAKMKEAQEKMKKDLGDSAVVSGAISAPTLDPEFEAYQARLANKQEEVKKNPSNVKVQRSPMRTEEDYYDETDPLSADCHIVDPEDHQATLIWLPGMGDTHQKSGQLFQFIKLNVRELIHAYLYLALSVTANS